MKYLTLFIFISGMAGNLSADCPSAVWEVIDSDEYMVIKDTESCPVGWEEVNDPDYLPFTSICDTTKGTCDESAMCTYQS
jgi:hypothetical protein